MTGDLTLQAALAAAVVALAGAVGVLYRSGEQRHASLEKRTESHLQVATEQMKILAMLELHMRGFQTSLERLGGDQSQKLETIEGKIDGRNEVEVIGHAAQMRALSSIETLLRVRQDDPSIVDRRPRGDAAK